MLQCYRKYIILLLLLTLTGYQLNAQSFGQQNVIDYANNGPIKVIGKDLNNDGDQDLISGSYWNSSLNWYKNNGNGTFTTKNISQNMNNVNDLEVGDINGDSSKDIVTSSFTHIKLFTNKGSGNFSKDTIDAVNNATTIAITDINSDSHQDIVAGIAGNNEIVWFENDGHQQFTKRIIATNVQKVEDIDVGYLNSDQKPDIIYASKKAKILGWFENKRNGKFQNHIINNNASGVKAVDIGDINNDGKSDILTVSLTNNLVQWYANDSNKNFKSRTITQGLSAPYDVKTQDLNGDGYLDVVVPAFYGNRVVWLENDSTQNFKTHTITNKSNGASAVGTSDIDGNGSPDVLSTSYNDFKVAWYKNQFDFKKKDSTNKKQALKFDGKDDYLKIPQKKLWDIRGDFSISFKIWSANWNQKGRLFHKHNAYTLYLNDDNTLRFHNYKNGSTGKGMSLELKDSAWHHILASYDSSKGKIAFFIDGFKVGSKLVGSPLQKSDSSILVGLDDDRKSYAFSGKIDRFSVHDTILGKKAIDKNFCPNNNIQQLSTIGFWNLEKGKTVRNRINQNPTQIKSPNGPTWVKGDTLHCKEEPTKITVCRGYGKNIVSSKIGTLKNGDSIHKVFPAYANKQDVLGQPDKPFYSLGFGDSTHVVIAFDSFMKGDLTIYESTWNSQNYLEEADVYVSHNKSEWEHIGKANNQNNQLGDIHPYKFDLDSIVYKYVLIVDKTDKSQFNGNAGAFDVTAICAEKTLNQFRNEEVGSCGYFSNTMLEANQGTQKNQKPLKSSYSNPYSTIGPIDQNFFSLGFGDSTYIKIQFNKFMTGKLTLYEETWGANNYFEKANVYVSEEGQNWRYVGQANNKNRPKKDIHPFTFNLDSIRFQQVMLVENSNPSNFNSKAGGYDLNALCAEKVAPVQKDNPEPSCQYYANSIVKNQQGVYKDGTPISSSRSDPKSTLNKPDTPLYSLGFQNNMNQKPYIILSFGQLVTGKLSVYEHDNNPLETADVYVGKDTSNWHYVGVAHNYTKKSKNVYATTFELDTTNYQYVKLVNTTDKSLWGAKGDGFDLLGICAEKQISPNQTLSAGCFSVKHVMNKENDDNTLTKRYKVINKCDKSWDYTAFELKPGTKVLYANSQENYSVINPANKPFYSLKFECDKSACFKNGASKWFEFTIDSKDTLPDSRLKSKAGNQEVLMNFGKNRVETSSTSEDVRESKRTFKAYPNPVKKGQDLIIQFSKAITTTKNVNILDNDGTVIKSIPIPEGSYALATNTTNLKPGLYFIKSGEKVIKVIVR